VEAYNGFAKWIFFGGDGVISDNDPEEQERRLKYNDLVANAAIFQTTVDLTGVLRELAAEGMKVRAEDVTLLSPYIRRTIKRFGEYVIDMDQHPDPLDGALVLEPAAGPPKRKGREDFLQTSDDDGVAA
jgi:hypothetical protein